MRRFEDAARTIRHSSGGELTAGLQLFRGGSHVCVYGAAFWKRLVSTRARRTTCKLTDPGGVREGAVVSALVQVTRCTVD